MVAKDPNVKFIQGTIFSQIQGCKKITLYFSTFELDFYLKSPCD